MAAEQNTFTLTSSDTGYTYNVTVADDTATITWLDADRVECVVESGCPGGVLLACDVPDADQRLIADAVAGPAPDYDLTTVEGRKRYLNDLAVSRDMVVPFKIWAKGAHVRCYVGDEWVEIDDEGYLVCKKMHKTCAGHWHTAETRYIADGDYSFRVGALVVADTPQTLRSTCRGCRTPIRSWSDGAARGLCHDCA